MDQVTRSLSHQSYGMRSTTQQIRQFQAHHSEERHRRLGELGRCDGEEVLQ